MKVFEFYFNPKSSKEDKIFDSFLFEPENILEKKLGSLYLVGELSNVLPQNLQLLEKLSTQIKKEYYRVSERTTEAALKESLRKANEFLSDAAQKGNVSWLGNLKLAAISLSDSIFNCTKVGNFKIFLFRRGEVFDIGKNLELQEIEPYPLKVFGNIVSGKLSPEDKIIVLSNDIFEFFASQNLITEIARLEEIEEKKLKNLLQSKENLLGETSGICLLIDLKGELDVKKVQKKEKITFEKIIPFSFAGIFPKRFGLRFPKRLFKIKFPLLKLPRLRLGAFDRAQPRASAERPFKFPELRLGKPKKLLPPLGGISILQKAVKAPWSLKYITGLWNQKNLIIISTLLLILLIGNFIFSLEKEREIKKAQAILEEAKSEILLAEGALILKDEKRANTIYQQTWQKISPQIKVGGVLEKEFSELKEEIEGKLFHLNKLEKISDPEILLDFQGLNFIPQKMVIAGQKLYFFSLSSPNFYQLSIGEKTKNFVETGQKFSLAASIEGKKLLLYSRPDTLFTLKNNQLGEVILLKTPYPDFYFNSFSTYKSNLYFLDSKRGEIIKYLLKEGEGELSGNLWLSPNQKRPIEAKSMAIDGSLWILSNENTIDRFYTGNWQETLTFDFFPYPKNFSKLFASPALPYLYLLEPSQKRIVILSKLGQVAKQFQSEKFDNLKDFLISEGDKIIYILNGLKVYQIKL